MGNNRNQQQLIVNPEILCVRACVRVCVCVCVYSFTCSHACVCGVAVFLSSLKYFLSEESFLRGFG